MSTTHDSGPRSNRNPILSQFRRQTRTWIEAQDRVHFAGFWAVKVTGKIAPDTVWLNRATVSEQVFAARVLYRYTAVFA